MDPWIVPIMVAAIMALPGLVTLWAQMRRDSTDIASRYQDMLEDEICTRRLCERYIRQLKTQLKDADIEPDSPEVKIK